MKLHNARVTRTCLASAICVILGLGLAGCGLKTKMTDMWNRADSGYGKRILVAAFDSSLPKVQERAQAMGQAVVTALEHEPGVVLADAKEFDTLVGQSGASPSQQAQAAIGVARRLGINGILTGQVTDFSLHNELRGIWPFQEGRPFVVMELDLKLLDISHGVVDSEKALTASIQIDDVLAQGIRQGQDIPPDLAVQLEKELMPQALDWARQRVAELPWAAFVLELKDGQALLTVARDTGISQGAVLVAHAPGESIKTGSGRTVSLPGAPVADLVLGEIGEKTTWAKVEAREGEGMPPLTTEVIVRSH